MKKYLIYINLLLVACVFLNCVFANAQSIPSTVNINASTQPITYDEIKLLKQEGKIDQAKKLAISYLQLHPTDADVQLLLGSIYLREKNYAAAENVLEPALKNYPAYLDVRLVLIDVKLSEKNYVAAMQLVDEGLKFSPGNNNLLQEKDKIIKLQEAPELPPPTLAAKPVQTVSPILSQAAASVAAQNVTPQAKTKITYELINQEFKKGNFSKVEEMSKEYLKDYPKDADVYFLLGRIYAKQKNYTLAKQNLNEALSLKPSYKDVRIFLIQQEMGKKDFKSALDLADKGLVLSPNDPDLLYAKASIYYTQKQYPQAEIVLKILLKKNPHDVKAQKMLADLTQAQKPKKPNITLEMINQYFKDNNYTEAENLANTYLKSSPKDTDVIIVLAKIYEKQKKYQLAIQKANEVLSINPLDKDARLFVINQQITLKDYDAALETANKGLELKPNNYDFQYAKAGIYYAAKEYREAAIILKNLLKTNPKDEKAQKMFADIADINPGDAIGPNQFGMSQQLYRVSHNEGVWDYTRIFYSRDTDYGTVATRLNYAGRLQQNGSQEEIEYYPRINKYLYFDLIADYADNLALFPKYAVGGEAYASIPTLFDISGGGKYSNIDITYFDTYTGSIAKTFGQYWISFRPYQFEPKAGDISTLYTVSARRYFKTPDFYVGMTLGAGHSPDLANLQTVNFIVINNKLAYLNASIPINNHRTVVELGIGYDRWVFPDGTLWQLKNGSVAVRVRF